MMAQKKNETLVKKVATTSAAASDKIDDLKYKLSSINVKYVYQGPKEFENKTLKKAHEGDIGFDVIATDVEYDTTHDVYIYHTGIYCESINKGTGCFAMPRSSVYKEFGNLCNGVGLADTYIYRGELCFVFQNRITLQQRIRESFVYNWLATPWYKKLFTNFDKWCYEKEQQDTWARMVLNESKYLEYAPYKVGERVGQLVWMKFPNVKLKKLSDKTKLSETDRGEGGFGSTNK